MLDSVQESPRVIQILLAVAAAVVRWVSERSLRRVFKMSREEDRERYEELLCHLREVAEDVSHLARLVRELNEREKKE